MIIKTIVILLVLLAIKSVESTKAKEICMVSNEKCSSSMYSNSKKYKFQCEYKCAASSNLIVHKRIHQ